MISPVELVKHVPSAEAYVLIVLVVASESILLVGIFVPTLSLLLCAGFLARIGVLCLPVVIGCAVAAVVAGDLLAYCVGRRCGPSLQRSRLARRLPELAWVRSTQLVRRHGGPGVLMCRFLPAMRTIAPHVAGIAEIRYRRLAPYSVIAAVLWASGEAGAGYLAGSSFRLLTMGGWVVAGVALAIVAGVTLFVWCRRRFRARLLKTDPASDGCSEPEVGLGVEVEEQLVS